MEICFFFYGYGSEYVLHPFFRYVRSMGFDAFEVNLFEGGDPTTILRALKNRDVVFLTSAHLLRGAYSLQKIYPEIAGACFAPVELISELRPICSVYYPHDLVEPIVLEEDLFIDCFDIYLIPEPHMGFYEDRLFCQNVGWIKHRGVPVTNPKVSRVWPISEFIGLRKQGLERSSKLLAPLLQQDVAIKFPQWWGHQEFEDYYRSLGLQVIDAGTNTFDCILNADLVVSNGMSSVVAEAYLSGKNVIHVGSSHVQRQRFSHYSDIYFVSWDSLSEIRLNEIAFRGGRQPSLKPFDFALALETITGWLEGKALRGASP